MPHVPTEAPAAILHAPPQHCASVEQMSPSTTQNEGFVQTPLLQKLDAHCEFIVHGLPAVGFVPSGLQAPPPLPSGAHVPLQQSVFTAHDALSATHCVLEQLPPTHDPVQHVLPVVHASPGSEHSAFCAAHLPLVASQFAVQQSVLLVHVSATGLHVPVSARLPSRIMSMKPSGPPLSCMPIDEPSVSPSPPPASLVSMGASESLPHAVTITLVSPAATNKPRTVHGSFLCIAIRSSLNAIDP